ncbi:type II toxin-antitoxin system RelE/ParE family toxin [Testudinibacter sp. P27/CKL/0425]
MREITYSAIANQDIETIMINITEFVGLQSAVNVINDIQKSIALLSTMPDMGAKGDVEGTREIYPRGYRVVYRTTETHILIITVLHCRRLYPPLSSYENHNEI